jgi:hypothetical protein
MPELATTNVTFAIGLAHQRMTLVGTLVCLPGAGRRRRRADPRGRPRYRTRAQARVSPWCTGGLASAIVENRT